MPYHCFFSRIYLELWVFLLFFHVFFYQKCVSFAPKIFQKWNLDDSFLELLEPCGKTGVSLKALDIEQGWFKNYSQHIRLRYV